MAHLTSNECQVTSPCKPKVGLVFWVIISTEYLNLEDVPPPKSRGCGSSPNKTCYNAHIRHGPRYGGRSAVPPNKKIK